MIDIGKDCDLIDTMGFKMYVPKSDRVMYKHLSQLGYWESGITTLFMERLKAGYVVVDVGASWGYFSLLASRLVGESGQVISFEPEADNYEILQANYNLNQRYNLTAIGSAIGSKSQEAKIYLSLSGNFGDHRCYPVPGEDRESEDIGMFSLDDSLDLEVDLLKIDVQGYELEVLRGAKKVLSQDNIKIVFEFWRHGLLQAGSDPKDLWDILKTHGFEKIYRVNHDGSLDEIEFEHAMILCSGESYLHLYTEKKRGSLDDTEITETSKKKSRGRRAA